MRKLLYIVSISFFSCFISAQTNLVQNPSFENVSICPSAASQLSLSLPWFDAGTGTSDLFASCATNSDVGVPINLLGNQIPNSGNNYSGIFTACNDYREYMEVPLSSSLTAGIKYFVSFYVSLADTVAYTSSSIGAYFSTGALSVGHYSPIPVSPQVNNASNNYFNSTTWKKVNGSFYAGGGENHLIIGNFNSTTSTTSMIVQTNTLVYNATCIYFYIDDICVTNDSIYNENWLTSVKKNSSDKGFKLFPNPVSDTLYFQNKDYNSSFNVSIYDYAGTLKKQYVNFKSDKLDFSDLSSGMYIIKIWNKELNSHELIIKNQ